MEWCSENMKNLWTCLLSYMIKFSAFHGIAKFTGTRQIQSRVGSVHQMHGDWWKFVVFILFNLTIPRCLLIKWRADSFWWSHFIFAKWYSTIYFCGKYHHTVPFYCFSMKFIHLFRFLFEYVNIYSSSLYISL